MLGRNEFENRVVRFLSKYCDTANREFGTYIKYRPTEYSLVAGEVFVTHSRSYIALFNNLL